MSIVAEKKSELISKYRIADNDTGSSFVQCAVLTERIFNLTEHFKLHDKDFHSKRGLLILVAKRRKHLLYIKKNYGSQRYYNLIKDLKIRDPLTINKTF